MKVKTKTVGGGKAGGAPADLMVCFPSNSRSHLSLMGLIPKMMCCPFRLTHLPKRLPSRPNINRAQASPLFLSNLNTHSGAAASATVSTAGTSDDDPTSPKVTCAGHIKVKKAHLPEALGFKKEIMQFFGALSSLRVAMRCFGSFNGTEDCSTDEEEDVEEEDDEKQESSRSKTLFSNWFMVLEDSQSHGLKEEEEEEEEGSSTAPPPDALLLMRCRSAPAKREEEITSLGGGEEELDSKMIMDKQRLLLMNYAPDFSKFSTEIVKENWVAGNFVPLGRSRSWKK